MSAPTLGTNWQSQLRELRDGWDSYGGNKITAEAILTVESFATVPTSQGGIQLEIHRDGLDLEIEIGADGTIQSVLVGKLRQYCDDEQEHSQRRAPGSIRLNCKVQDDA